MRFPPVLPATATLVLLTSCARIVPPAQEPARPVPIPAPAPAPTVAPPAGSDWRDWPASPGDWRYADRIAVFGTPGAPQFAIACGTDRRVRLTRVSSGASAMTIRTTGTSRVLATDATGVASLPASDPLLDAMGFSRGRFVVEMAVQPTLVVPAWAEVLRVVEDCRG